MTVLPFFVPCRKIEQCETPKAQKDENGPVSFSSYGESLGIQGEADQGCQQGI